MFVVSRRRFFFLFSAALVALAIIAVFVFGLNLGVDFRGGTIVEIKNVDFPDAKAVKEALIPLTGETVLVQLTDSGSYLVRSRILSVSEKDQIVELLLPHSATAKRTSVSGVTIERFNTIGPTISAELRQKGVLAVMVATVVIVIFIAFVFRRVSQPVSSWKYGMAAIITLFHDLIIAIGAFAVFSYFTGAEADTLFITALLTILGLSVNDTIVVFDRIRENLKLNPSLAFTDIVGRSLAETYGRSFNTSLTVIIVLAAIFLLGGDSTKAFSFVLGVGMAVGTYSSIFLAAPLLIAWSPRQR